ncbi:MbtH family protein [Micromonospora sp. NPDC051227]|uniref:MbtH family protein n=1 Tax=Micromonospora sp. NPDC051227 TaxID=3364285 RepID=UPI003797D7C1
MIYVTRYAGRSPSCRNLKTSALTAVDLAGATICKRDSRSPSPAAPSGHVRALSEFQPVQIASTHTPSAIVSMADRPIVRVATNFVCEVFTMPDQRENEDISYLVVVNDEGQHALWPASLAVPAGWRCVHGEDTRTGCLQYVEEHWKDIRPLSLVRQPEVTGGR